MTNQQHLSLVPAQPPALASYVPSWRRHLDAEAKSDKTVQVYLDAVKQFVRFLTERGFPLHPEAITNEHFEEYMVLHRTNYAPRTTAVRFKSLRVFFKWLVEEGVIPELPMRVKLPPDPEDNPRGLTEPQLTRLLATCSPPKEGSKRSRAFYLRDSAILRLLVDTGIRVGELVRLKYDDIDWIGQGPGVGSVIPILGKGGRRRYVPYGHKVSRDLDRWARVRSELAKRQSEALFVNQVGKPITDVAVRNIVRARGEMAELLELHPHLLRHTFADLWLAGGGSEADLMRIGGWTSMEVRKYGRSGADRRAWAAHKKFGPGDRF